MAMPLQRSAVDGSAWNSIALRAFMIICSNIEMQKCLGTRTICMKQPISLACGKAYS